MPKLLWTLAFSAVGYPDAVTPAEERRDSRTAELRGEPGLEAPQKGSGVERLGAPKGQPWQGVK